MNGSQESMAVQGSEPAIEEVSVASADASLGRCLAAAREARGLSVADVAQAIKFSPRQIEAIEGDDFDKLPGATIIRGFIRSYAKLLRLDSASLLAMFDKQVPQVTATMQVLADTGAALPQQGERRGLPGPFVVIAFLLFVAIATGVVYNYSPLQSAVPPVGTGSNVPAPPAPVPFPSIENVSVPAADNIMLSSSPAPSEVAGATPVAEKSAEPAGLGGLAPVAEPYDPDIHQLIFVFADKSWVEVKDASQRIIFAQNNLPGTRQVVRGKPPFAVVIGNASLVQLLYEERQIDLQPYTKVDVARFNLE